MNDTLSRTRKAATLPSSIWIPSYALSQLLEQILCSFPTDVFRHQAGDPALSRAKALRQAMLALIDGPGHVDAEGRTVFSYAHPIFWAPFTLVGDGGGARPP